MKLRLCLFAAIIGGSLIPSMPAGAAEETRTEILASGPVVFAGSAADPESNALDGENVTIKYFKKNSDGKWVLKHKETSKINKTIAFGDARPALSNKGKCKMVAKWAGNAAFAASKDSRPFNCKTGAVDFS